MILNFLKNMFSTNKRTERDTDKEVEKIMQPLHQQAKDINEKAYQVSKIIRQTVVYEVSQVTKNR